MPKEFIGWEVELKNGTIIREGTMDWKKVPKKDIQRLSLFHFNNRRWDLTGKQAYFVKTRASMVPGVQESLRVEERTIGYYEGAQKIHYTVNEFTGQFKMTVVKG